MKGSKITLENVSRKHKKEYKNIIQKIETAQKEFKERFGCSQTPWDSFSNTSITVIEDELRVWINPRHQRYLDSGWYSIEQLEGWLTGKSVLRNHIDWEAFYLYCSIDGLWLIDYQIKHFLGHPVSYPHIRGIYNDIEKPELSKKDLVPGKLTKNFIRVVEGFGKDVVADQFYIDRMSILEFNRYFKNIDQQHKVNGQIQSFLLAFASIGLLYSGPCNTPEERINKNWWCDLIYAEGLWDVLKSKVLDESQVKSLEELFKKSN